MNGVEALASWLTPTFLFCVVNITIATIFIASSLKPPPQATNNGQPPQLIRVPSFFERVKSFNLSKYQIQQPDPAHHAAPAEEQQPAHYPQPEEEEELPRHVTEEEEHVKEEQQHVTRSKSDAVEKAAPAAKVLQKSASEKLWTEEDVEEEERRRPATVRERAAGEDEAVDEKADDFINRFRQQLRLQRLDSLLRGVGR